MNLRDESPVVEIRVDAQWAKPDDPMELAFNFAGIPIAEFGTYEFQLYANDVFLGRALVRADKLQIPPLGLIRGN